MRRANSRARSAYAVYFPVGLFLGVRSAEVGRVSGFKGKCAIYLHSRENLPYMEKFGKFGPSRPRPARHYTTRAWICQYLKIKKIRWIFNPPKNQDTDRNCPRLRGILRPIGKDVSISGPGRSFQNEVQNIGARREILLPFQYSRGRAFVRP